MPAPQITASTFLVQELRSARIAAGLNQEELGKSINYSASQVSAVENGQRPPTRAYVAAVDRALDKGGLFERLLGTIGVLDQAPVWFRDWVVIEREAVLIRWFEQSIVPGLLQTEAYARTILEVSGLYTEAEIESLAGARLDRQSVLTRTDPPTFIAIIDENVLHRAVGGAGIMAAQCGHLIECASQSNIQLHVVPASAGAHAGLDGPFILANGPDFEAAHLDTSLQAQIVDTRRSTDRLIRKWEAIRGEALPRSQTIRMIKEVAAKWQT